MKLSYFKLPNCWHFIYAFNLFLRSGGAERRPAPVCANAAHKPLAERPVGLDALVMFNYRFCSNCDIFFSISKIIS
jgi:hypothetical protein